MNCPTCHKPMTKKSVDESSNPRDGKRYERTHYVCKKDDVWITTELPKAPLPAVTIIYKNWRGETAKRQIVPTHVWFGHTEWHKEDQWLLTAFDVDKKDARDFALKDIQEWSPIQSKPEKRSR